MRRDGRRMSKYLLMKRKKNQFVVIRLLPSNYLSARAFLKPSNFNPSLFSEWLDHCPWQTGTEWATLYMLPLMFY